MPSNVHPAAGFTGKCVGRDGLPKWAGKRGVWCFAVVRTLLIFFTRSSKVNLLLVRSRQSKQMNVVGLNTRFRCQRTQVGDRR